MIATLANCALALVVVLLVMACAGRLRGAP